MVSRLFALPRLGPWPSAPGHCLCRSAEPIPIFDVRPANDYHMAIRTRAHLARGSCNARQPNLVAAPRGTWHRPACLRARALAGLAASALGRPALLVRSGPPGPAESHIAVAICLWLAAPGLAICALQ